MKKAYFLLSFLIIISITAHSQNFDNIQLHMGAGVAIPENGAGITIDMEPAYLITDQIAIGAKLGTSFIWQPISNGGTVYSLVNSYTLFGKYYLLDGHFSPYVGIGGGVYAIGLSTSDVIDTSLGAKGKFGFHPRVGFDWGRFNFNIDFDFIQNSEVERELFNDELELIGVENITIRNSYITIRVGGFFFGRRRL